MKQHFRNIFFLSFSMALAAFSAIAEMIIMQTE